MLKASQNRIFCYFSSRYDNQHLCGFLSCAVSAEFYASVISSIFFAQASRRKSKQEISKEFSLISSLFVRVGVGFAMKLFSLRKMFLIIECFCADELNSYLFSSNQLLTKF